jgi:cobalt-zinc-cadmium efflux system outer membrane protein
MRLALALISCWILLPSPSLAAPLRLADALARAAERGPDQRAALANVPIAESEVRSAAMFPNPGVSLSGGKSEPVFAATLQLRLPILGQREAHVRAAERGVQQVAAEAEAQVWRLRRDTRVTYYTVARAVEDLQIAERLEQLTGRVAAIADERFSVGAGNRLEREQARLVHVRALQDVVDRQTALKVARLELARQLALVPSDLEALADTLEQVGATPPEATLLDEAARAHPELRALRAERLAALDRGRAARADRRPTLLVDLTAEVLDPTTCNPATVDNSGPRCVGPRGALGFDVPLFNLNGGPVARAEAEARAAAFKLAAAEMRTATEVRAAYEQWSAATARARFFDQQYVPSATMVEQMAREGFSAGKTGLLPLIEAQRAILEAQLGRTEALFAVQAARAALEEASGVALSTP